LCGDIPPANVPLAQSCSQRADCVGRRLAENDGVWALGNQDSGPLRRVSGNVQWRSTNRCIHKTVQPRRYDCRWLADRVALRAEKLDEQVLATAFESNEQKATGRGAGRSDSVKAGHPDQSRSSRERYPLRRCESNANTGEASWPNGHGEKVKRRWREPSPVKRAIHHWQQFLCLPVRALRALSVGYQVAHGDSH
jgi:hypothetical protein